MKQFFKLCLGSHNVALLYIAMLGIEVKIKNEVQRFSSFDIYQWKNKYEKFNLTFFGAMSTTCIFRTKSHVDLESIVLRISDIVGKKKRLERQRTKFTSENSDISNRGSWYLNTKLKDWAKIGT